MQALVLIDSILLQIFLWNAQSTTTEVVTTSSQTTNTNAIMGSCLPSDKTNKVVHTKQSKHNKTPLILIRDVSTKECRPLHFAEPILDSLSLYEIHETTIEFEEIKPLNKNSKTNIVISNINFADHSKNDTMIVLSDHSNKVILGHSKYSPVRRLKQLMLAQHSTNGNANDDMKSLDEQHSNSVMHLKQLFESNIYPKLATIMILMDCHGYILLTRRHSKLRSFPSCWVVPGGSVDNGESLEETAIRELFEETGINVSGSNNNMEMVAIWESIYADNNIKTFDETDGGNVIKYHHIVPIFVNRVMDVHFVGKECELKLDLVEVDCAIWIKSEDLKMILLDELDGCDDDDGFFVNGIRALDGESVRIDYKCLNGVYPNDMGQGIARGHRWGLKKLLQIS